MTFPDIYWKDFAGVYCITNTITGEFYVGSTNHFGDRYSRHFRDLLKKRHHCKFLQDAFNEYGESAFVFNAVQLITNKNRKLAFQEEQLYLDTFKPYVRGTGYNVSKKVRSGNGIRRSKDPVLVYNLDGTFLKKFDSVAKASKELGIENSGIRANCDGRTYRFKQWMFSYYEGGKILNKIESYAHPAIGRDRGNVGAKIVATRRANGSYIKTEEQKDYLRSLRLGTTVSEETKSKMSNSHKGKKHVPSQIGNSKKPVVGFDWLGYPMLSFESLGDCATHFGVTKSTLCEYVKYQKPYKGNFLVYLSKPELQAIT